MGACPTPNPLLSPPRRARRAALSPTALAHRPYPPPSPTAVTRRRRPLPLPTTRVHHPRPPL
eukprot:2494520-Prymnesium_polylepis.1